ncbi:MAG: DNA adenine methylase, partial [Nanoarchaeota archaeon]
PLRTPGGKSKVVKRILSNYFPDDFNNFLEPFIGGGSVALFAKQMFPNKEFYINDLNKNLYYFWKKLIESPETLIDYLHKVRTNYDNKDIDKGKELLKTMNNFLQEEGVDELQKAVAFYVLNKISFSGLTEHSSLSKSAYEKTFNHNNIDKLFEVSKVAKDFKITNLDYEDFIFFNKSDVDFVFLDPPYQIASSNLYGKKGDLHAKFNHERFCDVVKSLNCKWMITYNDNEWIREQFKDFNINDAEYTYCMSFKTNEDGSKETRKKNELIITNY